MKESRPQGLGRRTFGGLAAGLGLAVVLSACGGSSDPLSNAPATSGTASGGTTSLVVGSADFPESQIIAELYAGALTAAGVSVTSKPNIGSREIYYRAVQDGSIDLVPEFAGNLLSHVEPQAPEASSEEILAALPGKLPAALGVLDASKAESKDAMVVTKLTATKYQLKSIEDLAKVCKDLTMGAPATFAERPYGFPGLKQNYGCEMKDLKPFSDGGGDLTVKALLKNEVQVADIYTNAPSIPDNDLVVLEDPKNNFKANPVLPLYNKAKMTDKAKDALNGVSRILTTEDLANLQRLVVGSQKMTPKEAAASWLKDNGIVK